MLIKFLHDFDDFILSTQVIRIDLARLQMRWLIIRLNTLTLPINLNETKRIILILNVQWKTLIPFFYYADLHQSLY